MKKKIISIDGGNSAGELAYGYSNKKEAIKALEEYTGEKVDKDLLFKIKVMKHTKNEEDYYFWGEKCPECGSKNNGVISYFSGDL